ncbi:hypothetical protein BDB00DRAFT_878040 [Zychaea mexicana]|uniref:uncharacterized protein n=1 Tax=Zychaea mexicana TaxID=64656 RepID=UPI0022FF4251|nr:uncharacterized protein BDB00DRAFT_878040 [Zychaea mexicana]KAI9485091.1 hypothetical protein BDB00DRAFT_878040 [Zychaea mexicana]
MPIATGTLIALGAAGAAGAAAYRNSKNKRSSSMDQGINDMTPLAMGRRKSGGIQNDGYEPRGQAELFWRRNNGINLSHNADKKFPADVRQSSLK